MNPVTAALDPTKRLQIVSVVVGVAALLLALYRDYRVWTAPPEPNAELECVSAGLPARSVVCWHTSTGYETGYILFGDGTKKPLRRNPSEGDESKTPSDEIERGKQDRFYHTYEYSGEYTVRLVVTAKSGTEDDDQRSVTVKDPEKLPEPIELEGFGIRAYSKDVELKHSMDQIYKSLSYRGFFPSTKKRTYAISVTSDEGWHFSGNCQFKKVRSRYASYDQEVFYPDSPTQATFKFTLRASSGFFWLFSKPGSLSGRIVCEQRPNVAITDQFEASADKLSLDSYGVFSILGNTENPRDAYHTTWSVTLRDRGLLTKKSFDPIELSAVRLSLVDRDIIPYEERRNKAYIRVEKK